MADATAQPDQNRADANNPRICYCMRIDRDTIVAAIQAGAHSVAELQQATRACTGCGTCRIDLEQLLAAHTLPPS